jgi:hypothetical protein
VERTLDLELQLAIALLCRGDELDGREEQFA